MNQTVLVAMVLLLSAGPSALAQARHVIAVTLDGFRWQELFEGASREIITSGAGGGADTTDLLRQFWRPSREERRRALLPFFWSVVAERGQLFGDSTAGSTVRVVNGKRFSYPGYNELLTGKPDDRIDSNDKVPNTNVTVLEWLNRRPGFRGQVIAIGSWDAMPFILNERRSGIPVNAAGLPYPSPKSPRQRELNQFAADLPLLWSESRPDAVAFMLAREALETKRPRVLYLMLEETDEWAHERRYDHYLDAARRTDRFLRQLWEWIERTPGYAGATALLISTDHGRGATKESWIGHGRDEPASGRTWFAALGAGVAARGVSHDSDAKQGQFAATIAALLGEDFTTAGPGKAAPLPLGKAKR
ncbi:MAG: alkaline phosphatase family protein [Gemmatimonadota bacterium]